MLCSHLLILAHATCGALAPHLFPPLGALVPRFATGFTASRKWFPVHGILNGVIGAGFIVSGFGIARNHFNVYGQVNTTPGKYEHSLPYLSLVMVSC